MLTPSRVALVLLPILLVGAAQLRAQAVPSTSCAATPLEDPDWPELFGVKDLSMLGDGERLFIGSDASPPETGRRVAVYSKPDAEWLLETKLAPIEGAPWASDFGAVLAFDGTRLAVGGGLGVHVYRLEGSEWFEDSLLTLDQSGLPLRSAVALTIEGDRLALIAAHEETGAAQLVVFERQGSSWVHQATIDDEDWPYTSRLSRSLLILDDRLFVGVLYGNVADPFGHLRIYEQSGGTWVEAGRLLSDQPRRSGEFAASFAHDAGRLYVGEPGFGDRARGSVGRILVFEGAGADWTLVEEITAKRTLTNENLGASIAVSGDRLLVGGNSHRDQYWLPESGVAWYFERVGGRWTEQARIGRPQFKCGTCPTKIAVALAEDGAFVLSSRDPETGDWANHGRHFDTDCLRDEDGDGLLTGEDPCPAEATGLEADTDGDGLGNGCDSCPLDADPFDADLDGDGLGDSCDPDDDEDGLADVDDPCPRVAERDPCEPCQAQEIVDDSSRFSGGWGQRLASTGERLMVSYGRSGLGPYSGVVEVWRREGGELVLEQVLSSVDSDVAGRALLAEVAINEQYLLAELSETVLVRRWDGDSYVPDGELPGSGPFALAGDHALVTGPNVLQHYRRGPAGWAFVEQWPLRVTALAARPGLFAVGDRAEDGAGGFDTGAVRIFEQRGDRFVQVVRFEGEASFARLGGSLAVDGQRILVADEREVRAWIRRGEDWVDDGELEPTVFNGEPGYEGAGLALQGDLAAVGRRGTDEHGNAIGVMLYRREASGWVMLGHEGPTEHALDAAADVAFVGPDLVAGYPSTVRADETRGLVSLIRLPCLEDADDDGVFDVFDSCPDLPGGGADPDLDGHGEDCDNCRLFANADQIDSDGDGVGDACEFVWGDLAPARAPNGRVDVGDVIRLLDLAVSLEAAGVNDMKRGDLTPNRAHPAEPGKLAPRADDVADLSVGDVVMLLRVSVALEHFGAPW